MNKNIFIFVEKTYWLVRNQIQLLLFVSILCLLKKPESVVSDTTIAKKSFIFSENYSYFQVQEACFMVPTFEELLCSKIMFEYDCSVYQQIYWEFQEILSNTFKIVTKLCTMLQNILARKWNW